jgi:hypothetical protein
MLNQPHHVHVVVRSANERTTSVATQLACAQLQSDHDVSVITEVPFEAALRATYATGLAVGKKWTMALDADILLAPNAIVELTRAAELMPLHYVQVQGRIWDKILGMYRQAGPRVYRTGLLRRALEYVPEAGSEIRPESYVLQQMGKRGHPSRRVSPVVGLHDFEQHYRDLYRKSFVHAKKHLDLVPHIVQRCSCNLDGDTDFLVILKGLWDGLLYRGSVSIDSTRYLDSFHRAQADLRLEEKSELLDGKQFEIGFPDYLRLATHEPPPAFELEDLPSATQSNLEGLSRNLEERVIAVDLPREAPLKRRQKLHRGWRLIREGLGLRRER